MNAESALTSPQLGERRLVEDDCDAVGARYDGRLTGTFGALSTVSFYPAHHLAMGEGGRVLTSDLQAALGLSQLAEPDAFVAARRRNWTRLRQSLDGAPHRISGGLTHSDIVTSGTFWAGVYPGLTDEMPDHTAATFKEFLAARG